MPIILHLKLDYSSPKWASFWKPWYFWKIRLLWHSLVNQINILLKEKVVTRYKCRFTKFLFDWTWPRLLSFNKKDLGVSHLLFLVLFTPKNWTVKKLKQPQENKEIANDFRSLTPFPYQTTSNNFEINQTSF